MTTYYVLNNIQNDRVYSIEVKMVDAAGQESIPRNVNYTGIMIVFIDPFHDRIKKVFLKISQNLQENTCARFCFLIKLQAKAGVIL